MIRLKRRERFGCANYSKSSAQTTILPVLMKKANFEVRTDSEVLHVDLASGEVSNVPAPDLLEPAGLRTAREAGVFVVVDAESGSIYRAE